jgi:iron-sulfur cluster repair protein YtfE (RIC family)
MKITDPIREEHINLMAGVEALRDAGDLIGEVTADVSRKETARVLEFLREDLIPHATREDEHLYPVVARLMGAPLATQTMSRDHVEVEVLTRQLEQATRDGDLRLMRRLLYGLYHVVRLHFAKEERVYLPLLDEWLGAEEAHLLFRAMHAH